MASCSFWRLIIQLPARCVLPDKHEDVILVLSGLAVTWLWLCELAVAFRRTCCYMTVMTVWAVAFCGSGICYTVCVLPTGCNLIIHFCNEFLFMVLIYHEWITTSTRTKVFLRAAVLVPLFPLFHFVFIAAFLQAVTSRLFIRFRHEALPIF